MVIMMIVGDKYDIEKMIVVPVAVH